MTNVNVTSFREDIYNSLIETLYIESVTGLKKEILDRKNDSNEVWKQRQNNWWV